MNALNKVKASKLWDARYDLPTVPMHNNPWYYIALIGLMIRESDGGKLDDFFVEAYFNSCRAKAWGKDVPPGMIDRWPDGGGGSTSHDELMGAAWLGKSYAKEILYISDRLDGVYDNLRPQGNAGVDAVKENNYRFVWFRPFLKACAGDDVSIFSQIQWSIGLIPYFFTRDPDYSGTLKTWMMSDVMKKFGFSGFMVDVWKRRMKKIGVGPKKIFSVYLGDHTVLAEIANENF